jgi:hypothetical protein
VDEFDQAESSGETDDRSEVSGCLFAAECDTLEAFDASHALLDASAGFVERLGEELRLVLFVGLMRDHRGNAARPCRCAISLAGIALVANGGARPNIRTDVEQRFEKRRVGGLATGQIESDDVA